MWYFEKILKKVGARAESTDEYGWVQNGTEGGKKKSTENSKKLILSVLIRTYPYFSVLLRTSPYFSVLLRTSPYLSVLLRTLRTYPYFSVLSVHLFLRCVKHGPVCGAEPSDGLFVDGEFIVIKDEPDPGEERGFDFADGQFQFTLFIPGGGRSIACGFEVIELAEGKFPVSEPGGEFFRGTCGMEHKLTGIFLEGDVAGTDLEGIFFKFIR